MKKEYILQEIRRTAGANSGMALGKRTFETETGIKESDWHGVYWARWGDAIREAGFAPNKLQVAYETTELLDKFARLARELGRVPVNADIRLKARTVKFPSDTTFKRLGSKAALVKQLIEYCRYQDGFEDVLRLCETYVHRNQDVPDEPKAPDLEIGFVYMIKSGKYYKIGKSNAAGRRAYELALQLPEKARSVHVIRTDDPAGIEAYWHNRFASNRMNGEWFDLDSSDVAAFKRRKFM